MPWRFAPIAGAILVASLTTGCATKKYVRKTVDPVNERVTTVETAANQKIQQLDEKTAQGISRVDERATAADNHAGQAAQAATQAGQQATEAGRQAGEARGLAEKGIARGDELARNMENLDNYQPVSNESILFGFGKAVLTKDAKDKLDQMAQTLGTNKHYLLQVEGYTDTTGSAQYNLELSRRRADTVVNYLTLQHQIPLYRIHVAGFGKAVATAENKSREGRKQNRRVDVKIFSPQASAGAQPAASGNTASVNQ